MKTHYDTITRGGPVVDGTGPAAQEIGATGLLVTPGFVDLHTHFDGQAVWSQRMNPSSSRGVTNVILGNCCVGFAPCCPEDRDLLIVSLLA